MDIPQTVQALAALAHETRLALYRMLVERGPDGLPAGVIADRLGVPPSSLTFHVQHLHRAGLVSQRRVGRQLIYAADYAVMNGLIATLTENCCGRGTAQPCLRAGRPHSIHSPIRLTQEPPMDSAEIKELVRSRYGSIAAASASCCAPATTSCCSPEQAKSAADGLHG